jgi:hypothetical protein
MAVSFEVTQSNLVGFVTIPDDDREDIFELDLKERYLPSVYEGNTFSVDLTFRGYYILLSTKVYLDVLSIKVLYDFPKIGLTSEQISNDTIRISGTTSNVFPGTFFQFTMPNYEEKVLPPDTKEDFYGLNKYVMPEPTELELTYPTKIRTAAGGTEPEQETDVDLFQWHYWQYDPARNKIIELVSKGKN